MLCPGGSCSRSKQSTQLPRKGRLFAQDDAAGLVIYLHFPEAGAGLVALPLGSAVAMACEGHAVTCKNLIFFFRQPITFNDLVANHLSQQNGPVQGQECFESASSSLASPQNLSMPFPLIQTLPTPAGISPEARGCRQKHSSSNNFQELVFCRAHRKCPISVSFPLLLQPL